MRAAGVYALAASNNRGTRMFALAALAWSATLVVVAAVAEPLGYVATAKTAGDAGRMAYVAAMCLLMLSGLRIARGSG